MFVWSPSSPAQGNQHLFAHACTSSFFRHSIKNTLSHHLTSDAVMSYRAAGNRLHSQSPVNDGDRSKGVKLTLDTKYVSYSSHDEPSADLLQPLRKRQAERRGLLLQAGCLGDRIPASREHSGRPAHC